jgi:hypothetical protein
MKNIWLTPERKKELMAELLNLECQLSPENLTCDGELPRSQVQRRFQRLSTAKNKVVKELGYEPTFEELIKAERGA